MNNTPEPKFKKYHMKFAGHPLIYGVGLPAIYAFEIVDEEGTTLKEFDLRQDKLLHVIVIRHDLINFQHLFPSFDSETGIFTIESLAFQQEGQYRIFAFFSPKSVMQYSLVAYQDIEVDVDIQNNPFIHGSVESVKEFDGYEITLENCPDANKEGYSILSLSVKKDKKVVADLENHLGGYGFAVAFGEESLDYICMNFMPQTADTQPGMIYFSALFPASGYYKMFAEFKHRGRVVTADFVIHAA